MVLGVGGLSPVSRCLTHVPRARLTIAGKRCTRKHRTAGVHDSECPPPSRLNTEDQRKRGVHCAAHSEIDHAIAHHPPSRALSGLARTSSCALAPISMRRNMADIFLRQMTWVWQHSLVLM